MDEFSVDGPMSRRRHRGDAAARRWALARTWALGLTLAFASQSALAQTKYRLTPIGSLPGGCVLKNPDVVGLNDVDEVAGDGCYTGDSYAHAFLWRNNGEPAVDLGPAPVTSSAANVLSQSGLVAGDAADAAGSFAFLSSGDGTPMTRIYNTLGPYPLEVAAVNDLGQITGWYFTNASDVRHAFVWNNDGTATVDLGTFGGTQSFGNAINASGQVIGYADLKGNKQYHAFIWKNDGTPIADLGTLGGRLSIGQAINASGQVTGVSTVKIDKTGWHSFIWRNDGSPMKDIGNLGGADTEAILINDLGQVAGSSDTKGFLNRHAFVWLNNGTPMKDIGTLGGLVSVANGMNASGQVVGQANIRGNKIQHGFIWRNDGTKVQDLNKLIDPTDPLKPFVTLTDARYINDTGDVVAYGTDSRTGQSIAYLLQAQ